MKYGGIIAMAIDKIWDEIHQKGKWGSYPTEHVIRFVARNFYNTDRKTVKMLDFGCGGARIRGI